MGHDWGAAIGLRAVADEPGWWARVVVANGRLPVLPAGAPPPHVPGGDEADCTETRSVAEMDFDRQVKVDNNKCPARDPTCSRDWLEYARAVPAWLNSSPE